MRKIIEKATTLKNLRKIEFILLKSLSCTFLVSPSRILERKRSCERVGNYNNKVRVIRCNESGPFNDVNNKTTRNNRLTV